MIFSPVDVIAMLKELPRGNVHTSNCECCRGSQDFRLDSDEGEYVEYSAIQDLIQKLVDFKKGGPTP